MPKLKTLRAAAKRFKRTGSGKFKRNHAYHRHILGKKIVEAEAPARLGGDRQVVRTRRTWRACSRTRSRR